MKDTPKILIIGDGKFPSEVDSVGYEDLVKGKIPNIAEYDIVILDFVKITPDKARILLETNELKVHSIHNLLWAGHEAILITDEIKSLNIEMEDRTRYIWSIFNYLPFNITFKEEKGPMIIVEDDKYKNYYETQVNSWSFYVDEFGFNIDKANSFLSKKEKNKMERPISQISNVIASNGFKKPISFSVRYGYRDWVSKKDILSGPLTILQAPDKTGSVETAIKTLLVNYGIHFKTKAPTWVNKFKVPGEKTIDEKIGKLKEKSKKIEEDTKAKEQEKNEITRFKKLLFETGDELRNIVWDTLDEIGFKVNRYDEKKEDGSIEEGTKIAVLEITGKDGPLARDDLRQLDDWIKDYLSREGKEPKGIHIINHYRLRKPEDRNEAYPDDVIKYIERGSSELSVIKTLQLFKIFCRIKSNKLNAREVRKEIMENRGVLHFSHKS